MAYLLFNTANAGAQPEIDVPLIEGLGVYGTLEGITVNYGMFQGNSPDTYRTMYTVSVRIDQSGTEKQCRIFHTADAVLPEGTRLMLKVSKKGKLVDVKVL